MDTPFWHLWASSFLGGLGAQWVSSLDLTTHTSLPPIRCGFAPDFVNDKKGCTWLAAASDKVYQLLAHGRWFSPGTSASSCAKTGCHDIAEILLKVALKHQKSNQINLLSCINFGSGQLKIRYAFQISKFGPPLEIKYQTKYLFSSI